MLATYAIVGLCLLIALLFPLAPIIRAAQRGSSTIDSPKQSAYASGLELLSVSLARFPGFLFALALLSILGVALLLFLLAVAYPIIGLFGLLTGLVFEVLLLAALVYQWRTHTAK